MSGLRRCFSWRWDPGEWKAPESCGHRTFILLMQYAAKGFVGCLTVWSQKQARLPSPPTHFCFSAASSPAGVLHRPEISACPSTEWKESTKTARLRPLSRTR